MKILFWVFTVSFLNLNCDPHDPTSWWNGEIGEVHIDSVISLDSTSFYEFDTETKLIDPFRINYTNGKLIIIETSATPFFHILDVNNPAAQISSFGKLGRGPYEYEGPYSISANCLQNECVLFIYDIILQRGFKYLSSKNFAGLKTDSNFILNFNSISGSIIDLIIQNDSTFVGTGIYNEGRLQYFNKKGDSFKLSGIIPNDGTDSPPFILSQAFMGRLVSNPQTKELAIASLYSDKIEIYKMDGTQKRLLLGPDYFNPIYELDTRASVPRMSSDGKMRLGYTDICSTYDDSFFALYSGKTRDELEISGTGRYLLKFNWKGILLNTYKLPFYASNIACSDSNSVYISVKSSEKNRIFKKIF